MLIMHWLLANTLPLNLGASLTAALAGIVIRYLCQLPQFRGHPFATTAFWFLTGGWITWMVFYAILLRRGAEQGPLMALSDAHSILTIGFAWAFLSGDISGENRFNWVPICVVLAVFWLSMATWNWLWLPKTNAPLTARAVWVAVSMAVSGFATPILGFAFFIRYRGYAFPLLGLCLAYAACQQPAYISLFVEKTNSFEGVHDIPGVMLTLALSKVILAAYSYALFFAPVKEYPTATPPLDKESAQAIRNGIWSGAKWVGAGFVGQIIVAVMAAIIAKRIFGI